MTAISELFRKLEKSRQEANRQLSASTGMSQDRFRQLETLAKGMREGLVRFEPNPSSPGSYGTLRCVVEKNGKRAIEEFTITDDEDAAALITFQQQVSRSR